MIILFNMGGNIIFELATFLLGVDTVPRCPHVSCFLFFIFLIERLGATLLCRGWVYLNKMFFVKKYYHWVDVLPTSRKPINLCNLPIALLLITAGVKKSRTGSKREND
jgi:hypothetical protein